MVGINWFVVHSIEASMQKTILFLIIYSNVYGMTEIKKETKC